MRSRDPLDTSTLDAKPDGSGPIARVPALTLVYRAGQVIQPSPRLLRSLPIHAGRAAGEAGIDLSADPLASRMHAVIERSGDVLTVRDLGSRNGISVNGAKVTSSSLRSGDVLRLGSSLFVFRDLDPKTLDVPDPELRGASPAMQRLRVAVRRAGPAEAAVLVTAETGAGKELVARAIHRYSRRAGPFVAVNCSAITEQLAESALFGHGAGAFTGATQTAEGFFRAAHGGTLFLDELGDMPPAVQPKLLRALETKSVVPLGTTKPIACDVRVVAATNVALERAIEQGKFRADLYARLATLRIQIEPLRERREDVLDILAHALGARIRPLTPDLAESLVLHPWPHNVREVLSMAERLAIWGQDRPELDRSLVEDHLAPLARGPASDEDDARGSNAPAAASAPPLPETREHWLALLEQHGESISRVARAIGRSRTQVYRLLEKHGVPRSR